MLYMMLADGFEETEAIAALDVIRRGGIEIKTVAVMGEYVVGAHNVTIKADILAGDIDVDAADGIVLPGGMPGTTNLQKSDAVNTLLKHCFDNNLLIAAICAAPLIPGESGMLNKRKAVCFPGFEESLKGAFLQDCGVVRDGCFITAAGAGVAPEFGAAIVDYFRGEASGAGKEILRQMQMKV